MATGSVTQLLIQNCYWCGEPDSVFCCLWVPDTWNPQGYIWPWPAGEGICWDCRRDVMDYMLYDGPVPSPGIWRTVEVLQMLTSHQGRAENQFALPEEVALNITEFLYPWYAR